MAAFNAAVEAFAGEEEEVLEHGPEGRDVHGCNSDSGFDHGPFNEVNAFP